MAPSNRDGGDLWSNSETAIFGTAFGVCFALIFLAIACTMCKKKKKADGDLEKKTLQGVKGHFETVCLSHFEEKKLLESEAPVPIFASLPKRKLASIPNASPIVVGKSESGKSMTAPSTRSPSAGSKSNVPIPNAIPKLVGEIPQLKQIAAATPASKGTATPSMAKTIPANSPPTFSPPIAKSPSASIKSTPSAPIVPQILGQAKTVRPALKVPGAAAAEPSPQPAVMHASARTEAPDVQTEIGEPVEMQLRSNIKGRGGVSTIEAHPATGFKPPVTGSPRSGPSHTLEYVPADNPAYRSLIGLDDLFAPTQLTPTRGSKSGAGGDSAMPATVRSVTTKPSGKVKEKKEKPKKEKPKKIKDKKMQKA